eukprot:4443567-Amphidinium_carterae.3
MAFDLTAATITPWDDEERHMLQILTQMMDSTPATVLATGDELLLRGVRHSLPQLKQQVHYNSSDSTVLYQRAADIEDLVPVLTRSQDGGSTSDQIFSLGTRNMLALAWYLRPDIRSGFLADTEFRVMIRLRLSLPVHAIGARCHYVRDGSSVPCRTEVCAQGTHAHSCCRRLIMSRHERICAVLEQLCTRAGWGVFREQNVAKDLRSGRQSMGSRVG